MRSNDQLDKNLFPNFPRINLSIALGVPRLGIRNMGHCEGLHGMAQGGPSNGGRRNPAPATTFPQAYGMGETWPELTCKGREQLT